MNDVYEIKVHESTHTYANPYWLWIQVYFPEDRFHFYIKDICTTKKVAIYQSEDQFRKKLLLPSEFVRLDTIDNLIKVHQPYISPDNVSWVDITEDMNFSFDTEKKRERFKKQILKQIQQFINREQRTYQRLLTKIQS